jgi:hypothetical protein
MLRDYYGSARGFSIPSRRSEPDTIPQERSPHDEGDESPDHAATGETPVGEPPDQTT